MNSKKREIIEKQERATAENAAIQNDIEKIQTEIHSIIQDYEKTCSLYDQQALRQQQITQRFSPLALTSALTEHSYAVEEESESLVSDLTNKSLDVASFVEKYTKLRQDYHSTQMKAHRLQNSGGF
eukprot:TRINITY_DN3251_c0_g1_i2.p3 TRINITY_DN3251_c0_g1~~TRINITY_DN3251_c0_g1_i2.p3  ORF type:complete len:126 (-),score=28.01 TRINITY_DN3251_c0_g1_i2:97-474(-)